jgi:hypothetical protein
MDRLDAFRQVSRSSTHRSDAAAYKASTYVLLRKPEISRSIAAAERERLDANAVSATRVIEGSRRIGLNAPRNFIDAAGNLVSTLWPTTFGRAVPA